jgi:hypothetical protein
VDRQARKCLRTWFPPSPLCYPASRSKQTVLAVKVQYLCEHLSNIAADHRLAPNISMQRAIFIQVYRFQRDLSETELTSKTMRNKDSCIPFNARAKPRNPFRSPIRTCQSCIVSPTEKLMMDRKPLTAHQSESEPTLRQCSAQGHGLHVISGPVTSNDAACPGVLQTRAVGQQQDA